MPVCMRADSETFDLGGTANYTVVAVSTEQIHGCYSTELQISWDHSLMSSTPTFSRYLRFFCRRGQEWRGPQFSDTARPRGDVLNCQQIGYVAESFCQDV